MTFLPKSILKGSKSTYAFWHLNTSLNPQGRYADDQIQDLWDNRHSGKSRTVRCGHIFPYRKDKWKKCEETNIENEHKLNHVYFWIPHKKNSLIHDEFLLGLQVSSYRPAVFFRIHPTERRGFSARWIDRSSSSPLIISGRLPWKTHGKQRE